MGNRAVGSPVAWLVVLGFLAITRARKRNLFVGTAPDHRTYERRKRMRAKAVVFTAPREVDLAEIEIPDPGDREFTIQTLVTLMSMGTELICYRGESDPGTHWHGWVKYPFYPGYSCVGKVIKVGKQVTEFSEGDRIFCSTSHRQFTNVSADGGVVKVPEDVSDEEAAWCKLATITQTGVRQSGRGSAVKLRCGGAEGGWRRSRWGWGG